MSFHPRDLRWPAAIVLTLLFGALWWASAPALDAPLQAEVIAVEGAALRDGAPVAVGARFELQGVRLETGADGLLALRLEDGSIVQLGAATRLGVPRAAKDAEGTRFETRFTLEAGELKRNLPAGDGKQRDSTIDGGKVAIGVRGTEFIAAVAGDDARVMVHRGAVAMDGAGAFDTRLEAGFGAVARGGEVGEPRALPAPPELQRDASDHAVHTDAIGFAWQAAPGATAYVLEVAEDDAFEKLVVRRPVQGTQVELPELPRDARYRWRVASVDAEGLQGAPSAAMGVEYRAHRAAIARAALPGGDAAAGLAREPAALHGFADDAGLQRDLGLLRLRQGDPELAIEHLDLALSRTPNDPQALEARGRAALARQDLDGAERWFMNLRRVRPGDPAGWFGLAEVAAARKDHREALELSLETLERDAAHPKAGVLAARSWHALGDRLQARRQLEWHLAKHPRDAEALELKARY